MIEIGKKMSLGELKNFLFNDGYKSAIPFGPYQISKRQILDTYIELLKKDFNDSDSVILHTDFIEGTFHGGYYKIIGDEYGSIWIQSVKKDNLES